MSDVATGQECRSVLRVLLHSEPERTRLRIAELGQYMSSHVLGDDGFCCGREPVCRASALRREGTSFWRGQLSHVGHHYDMVENDKPWRVLVLGMETGRERELVTLAERRLEQQPVISGDPRSRKPHMKGTASALRLAFGRTPGPDRRGELLDLANTPKRVHVMDAYALVNVRLCSAVATGTTSSRGTPVMTENCLPHLAATVRILEPTPVHPAKPPGTSRDRPLGDACPVPGAGPGARPPGQRAGVSRVVRAPTSAGPQLTAELGKIVLDAVPG
jgi:hypothetical protein